jgi:hypothetical protein
MSSIGKWIGEERKREREREMASPVTRVDLKSYSSVKAMQTFCKFSDTVVWHSDAPHLRLFYRIKMAVWTMRISSPS